MRTPQDQNSDPLPSAPPNTVEETAAPLSDAEWIEQLQVSTLRTIQKLFPDLGRQVEALRALSTRLQEILKLWEFEQESWLQGAAALNLDPEEYRRRVYAWARAQVREEDWQDFRPEDYTIEFSQLLEEFEHDQGQ